MLGLTIVYILRAGSGAKVIQEPYYIDVVLVCLDSQVMAAALLCQGQDHDGTPRTLLETWHSLGLRTLSNSCCNLC